MAFYWNNNQEEESLTIIGDGIFSDSFFLEEARKYKLLDQVDGYDDSPIFRRGHGTYSYVSHAKFYQSELNECVKLMHKILPEGLK